MSTNLYGVSTGKPSAKPKHSLRQLAKRNQMCAKTNSHSTRRSNSTTMKPSLTQDSLAQQASTRVPHHQPPSAWNHRSHRTLSAWGAPGNFHKSSPSLCIAALAFPSEAMHTIMSLPKDHDQVALGWPLLCFLWGVLHNTSCSEFVSVFSTIPAISLWVW